MTCVSLMIFLFFFSLHNSHYNFAWLRSKNISKITRERPRPILGLHTLGWSTQWFAKNWTPLPINFHEQSTVVITWLYIILYSRHTFFSISRRTKSGRVRCVDTHRSFFQSRLFANTKTGPIVTLDPKRDSQTLQKEETERKGKIYVTKVFS